MAQFFQIVGGQGQFTLEDLQRCNIRFDRILVNPEEQQYGQQQVVVQQAEATNDIIVSEGVQQQLVVGDSLQYQQQYLIRHEAPLPQPPQPPRSDFQQQQQQQQQPLHGHQVYYTSDLPADTQVVLQQAQQIIDANMLHQQQTSQQRPQHLVSPAQLLSQPTGIHPAQPPPPQPPPPQHSSPQPPASTPPTSQQQLSRQSPLLQQLQQQQQQQLHLQQLQQQQQQMQQQQLQQQQQQQQMQQLQPQQLQQQQLQYQLQQQQQQQQQHLQGQQIPHQQVVMHASYINQAGTPTRQPPTRLLNQALSSPAGVALMRNPVRAVRPPRRPAVRGQQMQLPTRILNPQHQQAQQVNPGIRSTLLRTPVPNSNVVRNVRPRLLNPQASQAQHRPARPRTPQQMNNAGLRVSSSSIGVSSPGPPLLQQQQQQQLPQHILNHQVHQQQAQTQHQINQLKLTHQQQVLLNQQSQGSQQTRIITPQGTIVTQSNSQLPTQKIVQVNHNGPISQNAHTVVSQRASPHLLQQTKKVTVQPNNANEMDDLEESITAAIVQKHPVPEVMNPPQYGTPPPALRNNQAPQQITYSQQQNYQQHAFEQQQIQQHPQTLNQLLMDQDSMEDERQILTLSTGQRMTLAEFRRMQQGHGSPMQLQQQRETARQTLVRSKEQQRPVQRVPPMQTQQQMTHHDNTEATTSAPSEQASETQSAKMLIFLQNGEQRLITFTLPKESCTLQEVLEQVNVPFSEDTHIQCMQNTSSEIDYFVSVGSTTRIEEMLENHPMLVGDISTRSSPTVSSHNTQLQSSEMSTPEKVTCNDANNSPESPRSPPARFVDGMLALCKSCGYTGVNFSRCQRCKRIFTEEPKSIPISIKKAEQKKKEPEKVLEKSSCEVIKLNLLKTTIKAMNKTPSSQEKKQTRVRKPRGKQPDPEPVILTLSSDEEDSNSSMASRQHEYSSATMKEPSPSELEAGSSDGDMDDATREEIMDNPAQGIITSLSCRTIRIGSYRYSPKEKVYISSKGIKIVAPSLKNESRDVALQIPMKEIVRILIHFGKGLPVIFLYTMSKCGAYIRRLLNMSDENGPFYNPMSRNDIFKRITLLPDVITDEAKQAFKILFGKKILDELSPHEANDILLRTCPSDKNVASKMITRAISAANSSGAKSSNPTEIRQILIYPPGKGGIPINTEDYMCLAQDQFLNDVIIDFYLKYLVHDVLTPSQREKTHIFSTFFYKRLTTKPCKVNKSSNPHEWDSSLTPAQKRHARVKTWTKNVNIFEKDYIVVPINENCHWFVAIICFPSLEGCRSMVDNRSVLPQQIKKRERRASMQCQIGSTTITPLSKQEQLTLNCDSDNLSERDEAEGEDSDLDMQCDSEEEEGEKVEKKIEIQPIRRNEPIKQPCILIFDSLAGASRSRVVATLRDYLTCEYQTKISASKIFNKENIKGSCPKIPQQNNFTDCGLYLLQYVEQFFKTPIMDYSLPIKQLANWFDEIVVTRKREEISVLLKHLMHKYNPESHLALPDIAFPTQNGKLVETEESTEDGTEEEKNKIKVEGKETEAVTVTFLKRNFADSSDTIQVRKTIRLSNEDNNRSMLQIKPEFIKKMDSENQILIPLKLNPNDLVNNIQNSILVNKNNKSVSDKKGVNNQIISSVNCVRQNVSESDNSFAKARRINKLEDIVTDPSKKFKRNEC